MDTYSFPASLAKYFWDIDTADIDVNTYRFYIIERLLEYGDEEALRWIQATYGKDAVIDVIKRSKLLSRKSAYFYQFYYHLTDGEIICLQEDFQRKHRQIWRF